MKRNQSWTRIGTLDTIPESEPHLVTVGERRLMVYRDGEHIRALDNRCPHMGFPLNKGEIKDGVVTCYWHHARFDGDSGCAFDLFADDIPVFDTRVDNDSVFIANSPRHTPDKAYYVKRLNKGMEQNIPIIIAKSVVGLLGLNVTIGELVELLTEFGQKNHENWSSGMTMVVMAANLWPRISPETRTYFLVEAARQLATDCQNRSSRRDRLSMNGNDADLERLRTWLKKWVQVRHRDGAERTLLTAAERVGVDGINELLADGVNDRFYSDTGHTFDFTNKALQLISMLEIDSAQKVLPVIIPEITRARGAEESSAWRSPIDLIELIKRHECELREIEAYRSNTEATLQKDFLTILLEDQPKKILGAILEQIKARVDLSLIAREIAHAAAIRLAHFPTSNDINDWFNPAHTLNFAHAVHCFILRAESQSFATLRGLLTAAMAVYLDRFLNIPAARLPTSERDMASLPNNVEALLKGLRACFDSTDTAIDAPRWAVRYLRLGHPESLLIDTITDITLREDLDFHKIQSIEAVAEESMLWPTGSSAKEHLYKGAIRYIAAHCPTRRSRSKIAQIAIRLQGREPIHKFEQLA